MLFGETQRGQKITFPPPLGADWVLKGIILRRQQNYENTHMFGALN